MKRVSVLENAPFGLTRFHADPSVDKTWGSFGNFERGGAKQELTAALVVRQHGLCAYCEIELIPHDRQVEHVIAQSDAQAGVQLACDHTNLLAVCGGGSRRDFFGRDPRQVDQTRYLPPTPQNLSCDQARGNRPATDFLDPREVPATPSLFAVDSEGKLKSVAVACEESGTSEQIVEAHIDCLNLNANRLKVARKAVWDKLLDLQRMGAVSFPTVPTDERVRASAKLMLLPSPEVSLPPFFTTARSFFGPLAEAILAAPPQAWI